MAEMQENEPILQNTRLGFNLSPGLIQALKGITVPHRRDTMSTVEARTPEYFLSAVQIYEEGSDAQIARSQEYADLTSRMDDYSDESLAKLESAHFDLASVIRFREGKHRSLIGMRAYTSSAQMELLSELPELKLSKTARWIDVYLSTVTSHIDSSTDTASARVLGLKNVIRGAVPGSMFITSPHLTHEARLKDVNAVDDSEESRY